jgi:hypothetical protein
MKKLTIAILLLLLAGPCWAEEPMQLARMSTAIIGGGVTAAAGGKTVVGSEAFTGSDYATLQDVNVKWVNLHTNDAGYVLGGYFYGSGGSTNAYRWNDTFAANQYSALKIKAASTDGVGQGVIVRAQSAADSYVFAYYQAATGSESVVIGETIAHTPTTKVTKTGALSASDIIELRMNGTTVEYWKNGVKIDDSWTTSLTGGQAGIMAEGGGSANFHGDDWEGGNW